PCAQQYRGRQQRIHGLGGERGSRWCRSWGEPRAAVAGCSTTGSPSPPPPDGGGAGAAVIGPWRADRPVGALTFGARRRYIRGVRRHRCREAAMKIRHLVHSCLLVETAGRRLLIDPGGFSGEAVRALAPEVVAGIDAVAVTHQHPDHVDPVLLTEVLEAAPQAVVIAEPETARILGEPGGPIPGAARTR